MNTYTDAKITTLMVRSEMNVFLNTTVFFYFKESIYLSTSLPVGEPVLVRKG
jgi:hypothetical protein